jgi:ectoine hydroxylase-related dioxygenase (phytanoyl-CoA dioxygenase family)
MTPSLKQSLADGGFVVLTGLLSSDAVERLRGEVDRIQAESAGRGGVRNVLGKSAMLRELATAGPAARTAAELLGSDAQPTKLTIFDKTARSNWKVPWHQDLTITVAERREASGFGPWSVKDGLPNVQAPAAVLQQVLAIRIHLDDTTAANGALWVLAGSHKLGRLTDSQVAALRHERPATVCPVEAGDALLMSPLLVHASRAAASPSRRRVLHFEYSAVALPEGLSWA